MAWLLQTSECQGLGGETSSWPPGGPPRHPVARLCPFAGDHRPVTVEPASPGGSALARRSRCPAEPTAGLPEPPAAHYPPPSQPQAPHRRPRIILWPVNKESWFFVRKGTAAFLPAPALSRTVPSGVWGSRRGPQGQTGPCHRAGLLPLMAMAPPLQRG